MELYCCLKSCALHCNALMPPVAVAEPVHSFCVLTLGNLKVGYESPALSEELLGRLTQRRDDEFGIEFLRLPRLHIQSAQLAQFRQVMPNIKVVAARR